MDVILVETNLFFSAKLAASLKFAGYGVEIQRDFEGARRKAGPETSAIVVNLSAPGIDVLEIIRDLKGAPETAGIPILGFGGHKERELFQRAESAGCDLVVPNSAVSAELPALIERMKRKN